MHEFEHIYRGRYSDRGVDDTGKSFPSAEHPVVRTHPVSGRECLYVPEPSRRSLSISSRPRAMLKFLFTHLEQPQFQVRAQWRIRSPGDNRCTNSGAGTIGRKSVKASRHD